jgi:uncharacterized membrane protein YeaQ/YmgE (transglycosylase-associated protein family)
MLAMDLIPILIIGFLAGMISGFVIGGPATGYLASIAVGVAGAFAGALLSAALGIAAPQDTAAELVIATLGSAAVRIAMRAALPTRRG